MNIDVLTYINCAGAEPQSEIVDNARFVQECQVCDVVHPIEFRWIHLGQGIQW